jgi:hypothetical protein
MGGAAWTSPGNATVSDDVYTTSTGVLTDFLDATGYGFSIPAGATIDGIEILVEGFQNLGGAALNGRPLKGGAPSPTPITGVPWPSGFPDGTAVIGGSTSLYGDSFTPADINSASFGARIDGLNFFFPTVGVDSVGITVHFTPPPTMAASTPWGLAAVAGVILAIACARLTGVGLRRSEHARGQLIPGKPPIRGKDQYRSVAHAVRSFRRHARGW